MSLTDRFFRYSLAHKRPVKVMVMEESGMRSLNLTVCAMDEEGILYTSAKNKQAPKRLLFAQVLSASYARGDDGDTLKNTQEVRDDHTP